MKLYHLFRATLVGAVGYAAKNTYDRHEYEKSWHNAGYEKAVTSYKKMPTYQFYVPGGGAYYKMENQPVFGMWKKKLPTGEEKLADYDQDYKNRPEM
jgi:hypothetical protein